MPTTLTQPDGTKLECFASGDEYHNWLHDKDGYTIIQSQSNGYYCYAQKSGSQIVASDLIAGRDNPAVRGLQPNINISRGAYRELRNTRFQMSETRDAPTTGTVNNLVVFIRFSGESEFGQTISTYDGWFNTNTSSQKNYFLEASYNQLTVNTTFYPAPSGGYVVSWQDSHARGYFQPYNASTNTIGYSTDDQARDREFTLLAAAIAGVGSAVPADLVIDSDGDGLVDNVVFVISGASDGWSDLLWPHRWAIYDRTVTLRGKRVYDFNLQLRDFLNSNNVGVICHEFFHTLGAPDLYHYNEEVFTPVGSWDLMENNTNPPQHMGAYMKMKYGGWISSIPVITNNGTYSLNPVTSSTNNCYRINSPSSSTEYFVVEYRRKTGTYENQIPGSGLLVYRINTTVGDGNADGPPDEVYIYRPGGTTTVNGTISSAHFSSAVGRTAINSTTNPTPFLTSGAAGGLDLSAIGAAGTTISFTNNGGLPEGDATITWNPASISQELLPETTASQTLQIGNSGDLTLNYTCTIPTGSSEVLNENFENGGIIPTGWTQTNVSGTAVNWVFATGGYNSHPAAAYDGTYNARLYLGSYTTSVTRLVTPALDLGGANSASLSFWHTQAAWSGDQDELRVYYRTSSSGTWTLLGEYSNDITAWTQDTINLPNLSGTYQIGFEGTTNYGYGVCLDKVMVTAQTEALSPWLSLNGGTTASGSIAEGGANQNVTVGFNSAGFTSGTYSSTITITSNSTTNSSVTIPVTMTVYVPPVPVPFAQGFETGLDNWQVLKTNQSNYWTAGTATQQTGTQAAYITNNGSANAYTITASSTSHLFRDISFPSGTDSFKLRFNWKGQGQESTDYLRIYLINPDDPISAGTQLDSGQIGTTYNLSASWTEVTLDLPEGLNGQTKRLVFSWRNDASSGTQPPAAVDNIRIVLGDQSDAAVVIDNTVNVTPPPVTIPGQGDVIPSLEITGLTESAETVFVTTGYDSIESPYENAGLDLVLSGAEFAGATLNITHNLGFIPQQLAYRLGEGSWNVEGNPGDWTTTTAYFSIPAAKAEGDLFIAFTNSSDDTLPLTLSAFQAELAFNGGVLLNWISATETGLLGYYLYRSDAELLDNAVLISELIPGSNTSTEQHYTYRDQEIQPSTRYYYWLQGVDMDGWTAFYGPIGILTDDNNGPGTPEIPLSTALISNVPNPFNPETAIHYSLDKAAEVELEIFNSRGQIVRSYRTSHNRAGYYAWYFDGRDTSGRVLSSGVYYCRMNCEGESYLRRMLLLK